MLHSKVMMISLVALVSLIVIWLFYSILSIRNIEEPKYTLESKKNGYETRNYDSYIIAETTVKNANSKNDVMRKGFTTIADYIFGNNTKQDSIAMTVPVASEQTSESIAMTVPVASQRARMNVYSLICYVF